MISQERFDEVELEHGCGYWNVCYEHACPCAIVTENKGLQEIIYNSLVEEAREAATECEELNFEYNNDYDYDDDDELDCLDDDYCSDCGRRYENCECDRIGMEQPDCCR